MVKVDNTAVAVWARHSPARMYCAVVSVDDSSARTACSGAWNVGDADVELHDDPPAAERCWACVRAQTQPIAIYEFEMVDDRFDDGGEA